jgi:hypothetical protein
MLAAALALAACSDGTLPEARQAPAAPAGEARGPAASRAMDPETRALLDAARRESPIDASRQLLVGVLQEGRTAGSRLVLFDNGSASEVYRYRRAGGGWTRGERVSGALRPVGGGAGGPSLYVAPAPYPNRIAVIGSSDTWYSDKTATGDYSYSKYYNTQTYAWADFYEGSSVVGGARMTVTFAGWQASNLHYSGCSWWESYVKSPGVWSIYTGGCKVYPFYSNPGIYTYVDANWFVAYYHLEVTPALTVSVSGPSLADVTGTRTWEAMPANGDGTYTYQWSVYWYSDGTTQMLGTGKTQSLYSNPLWGDFSIRVTVTSAGQTAYGSKHVSSGEPTCNRSICPQ